MKPRTEPSLRPSLRAARAALALLALSVTTSVCCVSPQDDFDAFLDRADRTPPPEKGLCDGTVVDIGGREYLFNILIRNLGDVQLLLRISFTSFTPTADGADVSGEIRFDGETPNDPPLTTFDTTLDQGGQMKIDLGEQHVPPERSPVQSGGSGVAIDLTLALDVTVLNADEMCGTVDGERSNVTAPIALPLEGTTFGAQVYGPMGQVPDPALVPAECPCSGDAGASTDASADGAP